MININDEMNYKEEVEKVGNRGEESKNKFNIDNSEYNVNFFGAGRVKED